MVNGTMFCSPNMQRGGAVGLPVIFLVYMPSIDPYYSAAKRFNQINNMIVSKISFMSCSMHPAFG